MVRQKLQDTPIYEPLRPFLKLLLDLILSQNINSELIPHSSATLYVLICLFQDTYQQLVELLLQTQSDEGNKQPDPVQVRAKVWLPGVLSSADIRLEVGGDRLVVDCSRSCRGDPFN